MTPKQAIFVAEYLIDGNGARAARAAGVPEASAHVTAARWMKNSKIAAAIEDGQKRRAARLEITADRVLGEIAKLAFYDPGEFFDESGETKPLHRMDEYTRAAVAGVDVSTVETTKGKGEAARTIRTTSVKVKGADKLRAAELLGRHLKLFTDRVEGDVAVAVSKLTDEERISRVKSLLSAAAKRMEKENAA